MPAPPAPDHALTVDLAGEVTPIRELAAGAWRRRSLVRSLARANFHHRYRSTSLGLVWVAVLPLLQGAMLVLIFTRVVRLGSGPEFTAYVMSGTVSWSFFQTSLSQASTSIVDTSSIATRVYFPRVIIPALAPAGGVPGYCCGIAAVAVLLPFLGVTPGIEILALAPTVLAAATLAWLFGAVATIAHVYFRDTRYLTQAALMLWFYVTPVFYPIERAEQISWLINANPVTGVLDLGRFSLLGDAPHLRTGLTSLGIWIVGLFALVLVLYRRHDRVAVDRL